MIQYVAVIYGHDFRARACNSVVMMVQRQPLVDIFCCVCKECSSHHVEDRCGTDQRLDLSHLFLEHRTRGIKSTPVVVECFVFVRKKMTFVAGEIWREQQTWCCWCWQVSERMGDKSIHTNSSKVICWQRILHLDTVLGSPCIHLLNDKIQRFERVFCILKPKVVAN